MVVHARAGGGGGWEGGGGGVPEHFFCCHLKNILVGTGIFHIRVPKNW